MGLMSNLRFLIGSDVGTKVDDLIHEVRRLRSVVDDIMDLSERRWRKLRKRATDEDAEPVGERSEPQLFRTTGNPKIDRLRARRMRRMSGQAGEAS